MDQKPEQSPRIDRNTQAKLRFASLRRQYNVFKRSNEIDLFGAERYLEMLVLDDWLVQNYPTWQRNYPESEYIDAFLCAACEVENIEQELDGSDRTSD